MLRFKGFAISLFAGIAVMFAVFAPWRATALGGGVSGVRGDENADWKCDIADAIPTLSYLFASGTAPMRLDAADANDSGDIDIADAITLLSYLFANAPPLPAPSDACGVDPTTEDDDLDCASYPPCAGP
jgi:hypothetical protein